MSFAFEGFFFPLLRIRNRDLQIEKKAHERPNILNLKDSNFVQKVEGVKSEDIICRLCVFQVLTDTALLDGTNVFLVDIKVHVCNE